MKVAVVGMGLFGRSLAVNLARAGVEVIAIDSRMEAVDDVKDEVATAVRLDATDEKELRAQGIHEVDALVASIGDNFEANQLLVMLSKKMGIRRVIARAPSSTHARILRLIGADEVLMPEEEAAKEMAQRMIQPSLKGYLSLIEGYAVVEVAAPGSFQGKALVELDLKRKSRVSLVAIKRPSPADPTAFTINALPMGTDVVEKGDILILLGLDKDIKALLESASG